MRIIIIVSTIVLVAAVAFLSCSKQGRYLKMTINTSSTILTLTAPLDKEEFGVLINDITNEINRLDLILNPYNEKSEISVLNKKSLYGIREIPISEELNDIFTVGLKYSSIDPSFDISVRPLIELWGFGVKDNQTSPTKEEIEKALQRVGYSNASIKTNKNGDKVLVLSSPLTFDFGSYGKGYIISKMIDIFKSQNIDDYLIDFGGDTYAKGLNPKGQPWVIAVRNPRGEAGTRGYLAIIRVTNDTIVTSGDYERYFVENGKRYHHIIDAKTGYPSYNAISATIVAESPTDADVLSTMAFLMGTNFFTNENFVYKESYIVTEDLEKELELHTFTNY